MQVHSFAESPCSKIFKLFFGIRYVLVGIACIYHESINSFCSSKKLYTLQTKQVSMTILNMKHRKMIEDEPTLDQETVDALKAWVTERKGPEMVKMLDDLGWFEFMRPAPLCILWNVSWDLNPSTQLH